MHTNLVFVDENHEEIETNKLRNITVNETINMIGKINDFMAGTDRLKHEKTGWMAVDFQNNTIELMLKDI